MRRRSDLPTRSRPDRRLPSVHGPISAIGEWTMSDRPEFHVFRSPGLAWALAAVGSELRAKYAIATARWRGRRAALVIQVAMV
jgi:hypothetical protein